MMLATFDALLAQPVLLGAILGVGAMCGIGVERLVEGQKRAERRAYWAGRKHKQTTTFGRTKTTVPMKGTATRYP
jgi:hypothetical protein